MSNIKFTMKDLDGTVMPYTSFVISTSASANVASFTTNLNGEATVSLAAVSTPYYISKQDGTTESVIAYKFFVPDTTYTLDAELLFVDMGKISKDKNDKSIAALIEAKVVAVNAANRALQVVSAAAASFDSFDDRYLGAKSVAPTVDNDGNVLLVGAKYFNSTENKMYVRNSSNAWQLDTADSSTVTYDGGTVQDVLDAVTGPNGAASVGYTPAGGLSSINVQTALVELDSEKQPTLVSGTNIKTINNLSILGSGNIDIASGAAIAASVTFTPTGNISTTNVQLALAELDTEKQPTLVSGTNIKTINGTSLLGSGDISVSGGASTANAVSFTPVGNISSTSVQAAIAELDSEKQITLVSGTNIKTINSSSLLGTGDVALQVPLVSGTTIKTINTNSLLGSGNLSVQDTLVSGTNIKTINNASILGSGNINISGGAATATDVTFTPSGGLSSTNVQTALAELDSEKQVTLVSGTNIKTINGSSILGSGDIVIAGGTGTMPVKFLTDFGALGDGLSSSIAANNTAIASALTYIHSTGFNVIVPPGTYICDPFEINYIGYAGQGTFIGIDRERCIFKRSLSSQGPGAFVTIGNPGNSSFQAGMGMSKIMIDGGFTTNGPAISIYSAARSRFEECEFAGGSVACNIDFNITVTFATCIFRGAKIGIKIVNSNLLHFEGGEIVENTQIGMWVSGNRMISVSNVDVEGNGTTLGVQEQGGIYIGPDMGQDVAINDTFSVGLIVDSCWFESNRGLADIHVRSGLTNIERSTFFSTSAQTTNDIRIEGGRYTVRSINSSFTKTHNLYESPGVENGNIIMSSDLPGLNYNPVKTAIYGNSAISMRGGSVPIATGILKPLIQGGSSTANANGLLTVTFPTAYQSVPTAITCTPIDTFPGTLVGCSITGVSTTGFTAQIDYMGQSTTNPVVGSNMLISWISIGSGY